MNARSIRNPAYRSLTDQQLSAIDEQCDRFDQELTKGESPSIETFLAAAPVAAQDGLLAELLAMELEYNARNGREPQQHEYVQRFPGQDRIIADVFRSAEASRSPSDNSNSVVANMPSVVGNFRLIEEIGHGGMGVVWKAEQYEPVKRRVAVKLIKSELASRDVIARFNAEKQALAMMDHPNIARVLDAGTTQDGRPYFVMELVDGISITQYCDDNRLSVDERLRLFVPVCKAVQHAHQKGIAHRDLKPSNVLVTLIDGEPVPRVIDFGLAKAVDQNLRLTDETMQTEFGKVVGTVRYMSPEQAELKGVDDDSVDTRTDVYSLGVMLYELLTGSTPLDAETLGRNALLKVLEIIREQDPPRPSDRLSSSSLAVNSLVSSQRSMHPARLQQLLQGELDWVVMKALEKEPDRRYQTANDLGQDLTNYLTGATVTARPPSTWYQVRKFASRNRGLVSALLAIAVAMMVGIAGTGYGLIRANEKTTLAENATEEANGERVKANASERTALLEKAKAESNEKRAVEAEALASTESQHARDAESAAKFQLAVARYDAHRAADARTLLHQIPLEYRDNFEWHYCNRRFQGSDVTCYGHTLPVNEAVFTPDGTRVVSAGEDGIIRLWNAATGQELATLEGHARRIFGLAISPDGSCIASGGDGSEVRLWDATSGDIIRMMRGHTKTVTCVAFSPSGDRIASTSTDKTIRLWDTNTGAELITLTGHTASVVGVTFSPDGEWIASVCTRDRTVRIWDSKTGNPINILHPDQGEMTRVAFSPDGKRLATNSYGRYLHWDTQTWQLVTEEGVHNRIVRCIAFSPDGARFATAGDSTIIKLWDTRSGRLIDTFSGHALPVSSVAFSPDGSRLVSASADRTVRIWNTRGGSDLTLRGHARHVYCVAFSSDGAQFASGGTDGLVILRNARTGEPRFRLRGHTAGIGELSFSPDGARLASAADDETIRIWNTDTGGEVAVLRGHTSAVTGISYRPDNNELASSARDGTIRLWDARTHKETATLKGHRGAVYRVVYSPDGRYLASAGMDNTVRLWDTRQRKELREFSGHTGLVRTVAFDPGGERLVSGGYDTKVRVWDVASGNQIAAANRSSGAVFGVAFSPDGKRFATACTDHLVHLFDAYDGRELMTFFPGKTSTFAVAFSRDGTRLAAGDGGLGTAQIWNAPREHEVTLLTGHRDTVTSVTFSPDGSRLYSTSDNEKLVWDLATRSLIPGATWDPPSVTATKTPDHRWFATTDANNVVLVDLEYKHTPDEDARRKANATVDLTWHKEQANAGATTDDWYSVAFHHACVLKHDPDSLGSYIGLQSSHRRITARDAAEVDLSSMVLDISGHGHGTFYSHQKKHPVTTLPATPFQSLIDTDLSAKRDPDSNRVMYFDGASHLDLGLSDFCTASFTVEGWIKPDLSRMNLSGSLSSHHGIFSVTSGDRTAMLIDVPPDGRLRVIHHNPAGGTSEIELSSQTTLNDGEWHHFGVVRADDSKLHLYIDGSLEASSTSQVADLGAVLYAAVLGLSVEPSPRHFIGLIDEFRLWNTALRPEELVNRMGSDVDPNTHGLAAAYTFDQSGSVRVQSQPADSHLPLAPVIREALALPPLNAQRVEAVTSDRTHRSEK